MMKKIAILGAGGFAKEIAYLIESINQTSITPSWQILGYIDKDFSQTNFNGKYPIVGNEDYLIDLDTDIDVVIGIGYPQIIEKVITKLEKYSHINFPNIIHPNVVMDNDRITIGKGNVICAGNIFTTDITIGSGNVFNLNCTYGHDAIIEDYCVFNPGVNLSGGVNVHTGCLVGTGATVLQYLNIGSGATIGAGAVVVKDVHPNTTVVGVPAKPLAK